MKIALATSGLWKLKKTIELMTDGVVCRSGLSGWNADVIAGWGHKSTAARARQIAQVRGIPYIAFEDGFLRSVSPGDAESSLSLVMDRTGIYYDARQPSDLEARIKRRASSELQKSSIQDALNLLRENRLSKYNDFPLQDVSSLKLKSSDPRDRVLVIDQTKGDASIEGAIATGNTFRFMLNKAISENPAAEILIRVHPETMIGRKSGHYDDASVLDLSRKRPLVEKALNDGLVRLTPEPINPWSLLEACSKVYCVSSQLGFEGVMAGCEVNCFGMPFYAGWGLTRDSQVLPGNRREIVTLEALFAAVYFDYCKYLDPEDLSIVSFSQAVQILLRKIKIKQLNFSKS